MKRPTLILTLLALILIAAGTYIILNRNGNDSGRILSLDSLIATGDKVNGPIYSLLGQNKKLACAFTRDNDPEMRGNIYIDHNNLRGDFTITNEQEGNSFQSHLIRNDGWSYVWTENDKTGSKVKITEHEIDSSELIHNDLEYTCTQWQPESSKFTTPSDVTFIDLTKEIQSVRERIESLEKIKCQDCAKLQNPDSRSQCRELLQCTVREE